MRKFFLRLHLWLSLPFGLLLTLICGTGTILVFEDEITELVSPPPAAVAPADMQATQPAAADGPAARAAAPSTKHERLPFFTEVRKLHRWLLDAPAGKTAPSVGRTIIGISSCAMAIILISGLIIWIPRSVKALRNRLSIEAGKGHLRLWHDVHTALGIYAFIFLLFSAFTGPTWSFCWYREAAVSLFGGDPSVRRIFLAFHTGSWGGLFSKVLQFGAGLIGSVLPATGYYMWWKRTHPAQKRPKAPRTSASRPAA